MPRPWRILLVEDSPTDVHILARAFREAQIAHEFAHVGRGEEALDHLRGLGEEGLPDLVLLDLNLPGVDGQEVLARLKSDPVLRQVPVVVLSTTRREPEVRQAYQTGANSFIVKPHDFDRYQALAQDLRSRVSQGCWTRRPAQGPISRRRNSRPRHRCASTGPDRHPGGHPPRVAKRRGRPRPSRPRQGQWRCSPPRNRPCP